MQKIVLDTDDKMAIVVMVLSITALIGLGLLGVIG